MGRCVALIALAMVGCVERSFPLPPEDCQATAFTRSFRTGFEERLLLVALVDAESPAPYDVTPRLERLKTVLSTGDLDGDGHVLELGPRPTELRIESVGFDRPLVELIAPHLPVGYPEEQSTWVLVMLVTAGDGPEFTVGEITELAALRERGFLAFTGIGGIPPDALSEGRLDLDEVLADPRMSRTSAGACTTAEGASVPPSRSLVQLLRDLDVAGADVEAASLCDERWEDTIVSHTVPPSVDGSSCVDLDRTADGSVPCVLIEELHPAAPFDCTALPGRVPLDDPRACRVTQLVSIDGAPPGDSGWYFDDASADTLERCRIFGGMRRFTADARPAEGSRIRFHCVEQTAGCAEGP